MITKNDELLKIALERGPKTVAVACAQDADVLKAVEGAILLIDAIKGMQAQTLSNLHLAQEMKLKLIGATL